MKPRLLGTVLPTSKDFAINDRCFDEAQKIKNEIAISDPSLRNADKVVVSGGTRYYTASNKYAIVGRDNKIRFFEVKKDGDYFVGIK